MNNVPLTEDMFDILYADDFNAFAATNSWQEMIDTSVRLVKEANPTPSMRIELLTSIAMAQVGIANVFTEELRKQGEMLRNDLLVMPEEAKQIMENVTTILRLRADGMTKAEYPSPEEGS